MAEAGREAEAADLAAVAAHVEDADLAAVEAEDAIAPLANRTPKGAAHLTISETVAGLPAD